jgi:uncharacterized protein YecT (DUF1311 family)
MIKRMLKTQSIVLLLAFLIYEAEVGNTVAAGPSFDCSKVEKGSIKELICKDNELFALDQKMAGAYAAAAEKAVNEYPPVLKAEQRGWIKGRNDCWKEADKRKCVEESYRRRIAELQSRYRLVSAKGSFWYICGGGPRNEVIVTFIETGPPTLEAECGDQVLRMYLAPSATGIDLSRRGK